MKTTIAVFLLLATVVLSRAATFSLNPVADAFVTTGPTSNLSGNNYGGAGAISIAAPGSAQGELQSLLRFDLLAARNSFDAFFGSGQWMVQSVSLRLTAQSPGNPIFNAAAAGQFGVSWMQNDSWVEGPGNPGSPSAVGISYDTLNSFLGGGDESLGTFSFGGATSGAFNYSLGLSTGLLSDLQGGDLASLRLFAADSTMSGVFPSRTFGTVASRPLLTFDVVAVPEPSSIALVTLALGCCVACRFFRRKK